MPLSVVVKVVLVVPSTVICALTGRAIALLRNNPNGSEYQNLIKIILELFSPNYTSLESTVC